MKQLHAMMRLAVCLLLTVAYAAPELAAPAPTAESVHLVAANAGSGDPLCPESGGSPNRSGGAQQQEGQHECPQ